MVMKLKGTKRDVSRQKTNFVKTTAISTLKIVNWLGEWTMVDNKLINLGNRWRSNSLWVIPAEDSKNTIANRNRKTVLGVKNNGHEVGTRVHEEIYRNGYDGQCWLRKGISGIPYGSTFVFEHCSYSEEIPEKSKKYLCAESSHKLIIDGN